MTHNIPSHTSVQHCTSQLQNCYILPFLQSKGTLLPISITYAYTHIIVRIIQYTVCKENIYCIIVTEAYLKCTILKSVIIQCSEAREASLWYWSVVSMFIINDWCWIPYVCVFVTPIKLYFMSLDCPHYCYLELLLLQH